MCGVIVGLFGFFLLVGTLFGPFMEGTAGFGDVFVLVTWLALLVWCFKKEPKEPLEAGESREFNALDACFFVCCAVWYFVASFVKDGGPLLLSFPVIVLLALWFAEGKKPKDVPVEDSGQEELSYREAQAMLAQRNLLNALNNLSNALNNCADSLNNSANTFEKPANAPGNFVAALENHARTPKMQPNAKSGVITDEALFAELETVPGIGRLFCRVQVPDSFDLAEFDAIAVHEAGVVVVGFKALNGKTLGELQDELKNLEEQLLFGAKYLGDFLTEKYAFDLGEVPLYPLAVVDAEIETRNLLEQLPVVRLRELGLALSLVLQKYGTRLSEQQRLLLSEEFSQMAGRELVKSYRWGGRNSE